MVCFSGQNVFKRTLKRGGKAECWQISSKLKLKHKKKLYFIPVRKDENMVIVKVNCALPAVHEQSISRIFWEQNQVYLKYLIFFLSVWFLYGFIILIAEVSEDKNLGILA